MSFVDQRFGQSRNNEFRSAVLFRGNCFPKRRQVGDAHGPDCYLSSESNMVESFLASPASQRTEKTSRFKKPTNRTGAALAAWPVASSAPAVTKLRSSKNVSMASS